VHVILPDLEFIKSISENISEIKKETTLRYRKSRVKLGISQACVCQVLAILKLDEKLMSAIEQADPSLSDT